MLFTISISGFLYVSLGAFGAHALKPLMSEQQLAWWETAVLYGFVHTLAALFAYLISNTTDCRRPIWAVKFFLIGNIIFSSSLMTMALTDLKMLGAITPLGGTSYLVGWTLLAMTRK